jgi:alpha-L-rhamnosidase
MALLYRQTRHPKKAAELEKWSGRVRLALRRLVGKNGLLRDGIDRQGKIVPGTSVHAQTLALIAGLKGLGEQAALDQTLLPCVRGEIRPKAFPSAYWVTYIFTVLVSRGYETEVLAFISKHWAPMVEHGTTWENFAPLPGVESRSHAWSAHPLYHLMQIVGGIRQASPAWKRIVFRPFFQGEYNRTVVPTPPGLVIAEWRRRKTAIDVSLKLPQGVRAWVELPGLKPETISGEGRWTVPAVGLVRTGSEAAGRQAR